MARIALDDFKQVRYQICFISINLMKRLTLNRLHAQPKPSGGEKNKQHYMNYDLKKMILENKQ
jgi:hypothetical protein